METYTKKRTNSHTHGHRLNDSAHTSSHHSSCTLRSRAMCEHVQNKTRQQHRQQRQQRRQRLCNHIFQLYNTSHTGARAARRARQQMSPHSCAYMHVLPPFFGCVLALCARNSTSQCVAAARAARAKAQHCAGKSAPRLRVLCIGMRNSPRPAAARKNSPHFPYTHAAPACARTVWPFGSAPFVAALTCAERARSNARARMHARTHGERVRARRFPLLAREAPPSAIGFSVRRPGRAVRLPCFVYLFCRTVRSASLVSAVVCSRVLAWVCVCARCYSCSCTCVCRGA